MCKERDEKHKRDRKHGGQNKALIYNKVVPQMEKKKEISQKKDCPKLMKDNLQIREPQQVPSRIK